MIYCNPPVPRKRLNIMKSLFDKVIDRHGTASMKWDAISHGQIPLWVADMDFPIPVPILDALHDRLKHPVFGYTRPTEELNSIVVRYLQSEHGFRTDASWIVWLPNITPAINILCRMVGSAGGSVLTNTPMFSHILEAPGNNLMPLVKVPLLHNDMWTIDFEAMERAITPGTKLFILCNPHNPVGRVYTKMELTRLAEFCQDHDLLLCSDEIFCDLVLDGKHIPVASLGNGIRERTITLMSPAKTYNLAGLPCGFAIVANASLRERFEKATEGFIPGVGALDFAACLAAYKDCTQWREDLIEYLRKNRDFLAEFLRTRIPGLKMSKVEGTFLAWLDARELEVPNPHELLKKAGVVLSNGASHGGSGFLRLNFGCPKSTLLAALERMASALAGVPRKANR